MYYYLVLEALKPDCEYQTPIAIFDEYHQKEAIELSKQRDSRFTYRTRLVVFLESDIEFSKSFYLLATNNIYTLIETLSDAEHFAFEMTTFEYFKSFPNVYSISNLNTQSEIIKMIDTKFLLSSPKKFMLKRQLNYAERKLRISKFYDDSLGNELMYESYYPKLSILRQLSYLKNSMIDSLILEYQDLGFE